jgi:hypothetical protein
VGLAAASLHHQIFTSAWDGHYTFVVFQERKYHLARSKEMEKVWFKLRQTDYTPPIVESMGTDKETGPICLGHFISDLKHIDFPLNRNELEEFPANMPVFATTAAQFKWDDSKNTERGGDLGAGAPIAAAGGITVKGNLKLTFKREVTNHEAYDRLDKYIVQMNKAYIQDCLDGIASLEKHTNKHMWTMFVITGIMVARGATKRDTTESKETTLEVGPEVYDLPLTTYRFLIPKFIFTSTDRNGQIGMSLGL